MDKGMELRDNVTSNPAPPSAVQYFLTAWGVGQATFNVWCQILILLGNKALTAFMICDQALSQSALPCTNLTYRNGITVSKQGQ